jgi:hypothetical protein
MTSENTLYPDIILISKCYCQKERLSTNQDLHNRNDKPLDPTLLFQTLPRVTKTDMTVALDFAWLSSSPLPPLPTHIP